MMWAFISRTGDILQLIGLLTVLVGATWGAWKMSGVVRRITAYVKSA